MAGALITTVPQKPAVVLVHGLWMTGWDMYLLAYRMEQCGFRVYRFSYRSTHYGLRENAFLLNRFLETIAGDTVHLVGHSLGGLVIRRLFLDYPRQRPGRVVTLGTPHRASRTAQRLQRNRLGRWALGKSYSALTTSLPPWDSRRELGSIAGCRPIGAGRFFRCLPEQNDGTVAVDETVVPGAAHLVLPVFHMGMLVAKSTAREVCHFLHHGRFSNAEERPTITGAAA